MPVLIQTPQMYFFTQEISDFNKGTILLKNIDGEMSVHRPHLVTEAQRNTLDHVLCITADSLNSDKFLSISPPFVIPELLLFLSQETEFYIDVSEVLQGASGALHKKIVRPFRVMSTFPRMLTVWLLTIVFILTVDVAKS